MTLILSLFVLICLMSVHIKRYNSEYISRKTTIQINGIFVFLVFLSHFVTYIDVDIVASDLYMLVRDFLDQLVVTTFLFYSGYGVFVSILKTRDKYVDKLPFKIFELITFFAAAIFVFFIIGSMLGKEYTFSRLILACIGWTSIGNSNWYLFDILLLYLITYISFKRIKNPKQSLIFMLILSLTSMVFLYFVKGETRWYNTFLCFWFGMVYGYLKPRYEKLVQANLSVYYRIGFLYLFGFLGFHMLRENMVFYVLHTLMFVLLINHISLIVYIDSCVLKWLGNHIFGIYILQRIPMMLGDYFGWSRHEIGGYFVFSLGMTLILAFGFGRFCDIISKRVLYPIILKNEG